MKKLFFLIFLLLSCNSFSQKVMDSAWINIPENLKEHANAILRDYQVEYILNSNKNLVENVYKVITVLDNEGKHNATQIWHYDLFSKITEGEIRIYNKSGALIGKKRLNEMKDYGTSGLANFFDDSRLKGYRPLIKETPFTIVIKYSKKYNSYMQLDTWLPQPNAKMAVEKASLSIFNSENLEYKIKQRNLKKGSYSYKEEGLNKKWELKNLHAFKPETFVKHSQLPSISFPMKQFQVQGFSGNTESWQGFGKWSADLIANRDQLSDETKAKLKEMVSGITDPKEKAKIIYSWMQDNTRYISIQYGIGGWQPDLASNVDELKYGDCKGLANYTEALFKAVGIKSYYTLIHAGSGEKTLDPNFPYNQFNHVILCVPFDKDTTWVECTANNLALGYLGDFTDDRYALLIDGTQSKLVKTPAYPKEENIQARSGNIIINTNGSMSAKLKTNYKGLQTKYRLEQIKKDEKSRRDFLYNNLDLSGFTINKLEYKYKKEILPEITEDIEIDVSKYGNITNNRIFVPLNLLNKNRFKPEKDTARLNKIFISFAYTDIDSLVYQIPDGYTVERLPKEKQIKSIYGDFSFSALLKGNNIIYVRKTTQNTGDFPAHNWNDFRKYRLNIIKADKATAILRKL